MPNLRKARNDVARYLRALGADEELVDAFSSATGFLMDHPGGEVVAAWLRDAARPLWQIMVDLPPKHGGSLATFLTGRPLLEDVPADVESWAQAQSKLFDVSSLKDPVVAAAVLDGGDWEQAVALFVELLDRIAGLLVSPVLFWTKEDPREDINRLLSRVAP